MLVVAGGANTRICLGIWGWIGVDNTRATTARIRIGKVQSREIKWHLSIGKVGCELKVEEGRRIRAQGGNPLHSIGILEGVLKDGVLGIHKGAIESEIDPVSTKPGDVHNAAAVV